MIAGHVIVAGVQRSEDHVFGGGQMVLGGRRVAAVRGRQAGGLLLCSKLNGLELCSTH